LGWLSCRLYPALRAAAFCPIPEVSKGGILMD
jgi:hypothetical protein